MKKTLAIIICLFLVPLLFADEKQASKFHFEASIGAGLQFGILTENFYAETSQNDLYRVSWLKWETLPAVLGDIDATFGYTFSNRHSINFEAFFSSAFPDVTGSMEDFDALFFDGRITDFSHHENYTDLLLSTGFYADYSFSNGLGAGIGFEYENVKFRGQNGYAQHNTIGNYTYGYWTEDMPHNSDYTGYTVITYSFFSFYWKIGMIWQHEFTNHFGIKLDAWLNLYRYNQALDIHYSIIPNIPYTYFTDVVEVWFSGVEIRAAFDIPLSKHFALSFRLGGTYLPDAYGPDYNGEPPNYSRNVGYKGGFESWSASGNIAVLFRL